MSKKRQTFGLRTISAIQVVHFFNFANQLKPVFNMSSYPDDLTLSKPIAEFVTVASEYCSYLENAESRSKTGILNYIQRIIPLLYLKGSLLPDIEVNFPEADERFVTEIEWENLFNILRAKFGTDDEFWILDPEYIHNEEPLKASLAENLTDVYQDMKDMTILFGKNTQAARENAIHDCKMLFNSHWGYRVGQIIGRVHHLLLFDSDIESEEVLL